MEWMTVRQRRCKRQKRPLLIMAGAGSGKACLTHRIAWLMKRWSILGIFWPLPFTNKGGAWDEGACLWKPNPAGLSGAITHHVRILRRDGSYWLQSNFTIVDPGGRTLMKRSQTVELGSKMEWTDYFGSHFQCQRMTWLMMYTLPMLAICTHKSWPSVIRPIQKEPKSVWSVDFDDLIIRPCVSWSKSDVLTTISRISIHSRG